MALRFRTNFQVLMEHFDNHEQVQDAINCSEECATLLEHAATTPLSMRCPDHPRRELDLFCRQYETELCSNCVFNGHSKHQHCDIATVTGEEIQKLGEATNHVMVWVEEAKQAVFAVKQMRQRVKDGKEHNIERTREVFNALRKIIDGREEQVIVDIKRQAGKRENALTVQLERLTLLWAQLLNCLELIKKTKENKMTTTEMVKRRKVLERRQDHLLLMKKRTRMEPVVKEQREVEFGEVQHINEQVTKLGRYPALDPTKCEVTLPTAVPVRNQEASLMVTLRDVNNDIVDEMSNEIKICVTTPARETMLVGQVEDAGCGNYRVSYTPRTLGDNMISILVDGQHITGSPCKISVVLRDYSKVTESTCHTMSHYGRNKFGTLTHIATGMNDEVVIVDDANKCVIVLDCNFALLAIIGQGSDDSRLVDPYGVAVSRDGIIAVSDWGNSHQVKKYSRDGKLLSIIGDNTGNKKGQFNKPKGLVFSNTYMLYVVDRCNCRVQVFQPDDNFAFTFGSKGFGPGQFQHPIRIAIDTDHRVLVSDNDDNHISMFSLTGSFISRITCYKPWAITASPDGYIIAGCGGDDNKIKVWSSTHQLIYQFGRKGYQQGEFSSVTGIAINSAGTIFVSEYINRRVQIISHN